MNTKPDLRPANPAQLEQIELFLNAVDEAAKGTTFEEIGLLAVLFSARYREAGAPKATA